MNSFSFLWELMLESRSGIIMLINQASCEGSAVLSFRNSLLQALDEGLGAQNVSLSFQNYHPG